MRQPGSSIARLHIQILIDESGISIGADSQHNAALLARATCEAPRSAGCDATVKVRAVCDFSTCTTSMYVLYTACRSEHRHAVK